MSTTKTKRKSQEPLYYDYLADRHVVKYRFTEVIFGMGSTLQKHVQKFNKEYPETAKALVKDTYVNDEQSGGDSLEELQKFKNEATTIMYKGIFRVHKWHSNAKVLENTNDTAAPNDDEKSPRLTLRSSEFRARKRENTLQVNFQRYVYPTIPLTKRKILAVINGVYDVLDFAFPVTIVGKIIFKEILEKEQGLRTRFGDNLHDVEKQVRIAMLHVGSLYINSCQRHLLRKRSHRLNVGLQFS